jgi:uncharacterized SAM-binding protein YcdF (DUF218 family)
MFLLFKLIRRALSSLVSLTLLAGLLLVGYVYYTAHQDQRVSTDAIVVLGASQFDGEPSPVFANRLDHALDLILHDVAPVIITVGGKQPGDRFTEASAGRNYLIDSGLLADQVIAIPTGGDTLESMTAVAVLLKKKGWDHITVVSDPAHLARIKLIAGNLEITSESSPTEIGPGSELTAEYVIREVGGILHFFVLDRWGL